MLLTETRDKLRLQVGETPTSSSKKTDDTEVEPKPDQCHRDFLVGEMVRWATWGRVCGCVEEPRMEHDSGHMYEARRGDDAVRCVGCRSLVVVVGHDAAMDGHGF